MQSTVSTNPLPRFIITSTSFYKLLQSARPFARYVALSLHGDILTISGSVSKVQVNDAHGEADVELPIRKVKALYTILNNLEEQPLVITLDFTMEIHHIQI